MEYYDKSMFHPLQIKHEHIELEDINYCNVNNAFISQNVDYKYSQLPQFWNHEQLFDGVRPKTEIDVQQSFFQAGNDSLTYMKDYVQNSTLFQVNQEESLNLNHIDEQCNINTVRNMQQSSLSQDMQQFKLVNQMRTISEPVIKSTHLERPPTDSSKSSEKKKFKCQCEICYKQFGYKSNLFIHMRTHNGERPYKCSHCEKCFAHSGNLAVHMRIHSGERPYGCEICGKTFRHSGNLSTHLRTHSGIRPFECSTCGKTFRHSGNLSIHERIHSGIKPFQCKVCGKDFHHSGNLTTHMKKHPLNINISFDQCENNDTQTVNFNETVLSNSFSNLSSSSIDVKVMPPVNNVVPIKCESNDKVLTNVIKI